MQGTKFTIGKTEYQVTSVEDVDPTHKAIKKAMSETGKELKYYFASKVLKSGKLSKSVGGMFYRFTNSGNFIKAL